MMQYILMLLAAAGVVAADQLTKLWVLRDIPLYGNVPVWPGVFSLTYIQNRGAAWGSFQGMRWLFIVIFALFTLDSFGNFPKKECPSGHLSGGASPSSGQAVWAISSTGSVWASWWI